MIDTDSSNVLDAAARAKEVANILFPEASKAGIVSREDMVQLFEIVLEHEFRLKELENMPGSPMTVSCGHEHTARGVIEDRLNQELTKG